MAAVVAGGWMAARILMAPPQRGHASTSIANGVVVVEWLNLTNGLEMENTWFQIDQHLLRSGYAWVGVSAQRLGVNRLRTWSPTRYGTLDVSQRNASGRQTITNDAEREGRITAAQSIDLLAVFAQAAFTWAILEISEEIARRAEDGFPNEPVRTLDAIHLASALFLRQSFPDLVILSADERVRANAALLGFSAEVAQP